MDHLVYTAMTGAARALEQQAVITHNLANVATPGFVEQLALYRAVPVEGRAGEADTRALTVMNTPGSRMEQGALAQTGNALDVAIRGAGWFALQTPEGEAYTRAGDFQISAENLLVSGSGLAVLGADDLPIMVPERGSISFSPEGQVRVLGAGDDPSDIEVLAQLKLVNPEPETLARGDDGLFRLAGGGLGIADPQVRILEGFLEKSNVSPAESMVALIANARRFEMQMKLIQDASTNAERANAILSSNG